MPRSRQNARSLLEKKSRGVENNHRSTSKQEGRRRPSGMTRHRNSVPLREAAAVSAGPASAPLLLMNTILFSRGSHQTCDPGPANQHRTFLPRGGQARPLAPMSIGPRTSATASGKERPVHWVVSWQDTSLALPIVISAPGSSPA